MAQFRYLISWFNYEIVVPSVPLREWVKVRPVTDAGREALEIRIWLNNHMVHSVVYPLKQLAGVHFLAFPNGDRSPVYYFQAGGQGKGLK